MTRSKYLETKPIIPDSCYIAPGAHIIGAATLGENASVWYNVTIRADIAEIKIGNHTNIQDGTVVHVDVDEPTILGDWISVGHNAIVHSATVADHVLIGMGSKLLSGCKIGEGAMIAAGALVKEGFEVPPKTLVVGVPGKIRRDLTPEEQEANRQNARNYNDLREHYKKIGQTDR